MSVYRTIGPLVGYCGMKSRGLLADTLCHIKLFHQETQADTKIEFKVEKRHFFAFIQNKKVKQS